MSHSAAHTYWQLVAAVAIAPVTRWALIRRRFHSASTTDSYRRDPRPYRLAMAVYFVVAGWAVFDQAGRSLWGFGWWSLVALVTAGGAIATSWKRSYSARHRMSVSLMVTVALFGDAVIHTNHVVLNEIPFTSGVLAAVVGRLVLALVAIPLWAQEPLEYRRGALLWGDDSRGGDA